MMLLTKANKKALPPLYSQENVEDPIVHVKLFSPWGNATWYLTEYSEVAPDGTPRLAFGYVTGLGFDELGYISIDELTAWRGPAGLTIERDRYFTPQPLSQVKAGAYA